MSKQLTKEQLEAIINNPVMPDFAKKEAKKKLDSGDYKSSAAKSTPAPVAKKSSQKETLPKKLNIDGEEWVLGMTSKKKQMAGVDVQYGIYVGEAGDEYKAIGSSGNVMADGVKAEALVEEMWGQKGWDFISDDMKYSYDAWKEEQDGEGSSDFPHLEPKKDDTKSEKYVKEMILKEENSKVSQCKKALEDAHYKVIKKKTPSGRKQVRVVRSDKAILTTKIDSVFKTIEKDVPKEKDVSEKVLDSLNVIAKSITKIVQGLEKLASDGNYKEIQKIENLLKDLK